MGFSYSRVTKNEGLDTPDTEIVMKRLLKM